MKRPLTGRPLRLALAASVALLPGVLAAQEVRTPSTQTWLGRITILASRVPRPLLEVPASVTVVDQEQIEAQNITDMQQLTRYTPGLTVNRQVNAAQPFSDFDGFNLRGVGGNRVLTLVDGGRVPERITDGSRDYIDFSFVREAEVVRGPASVLWGADALGGVVALRTIDPEDVLAGRARGGTVRLGFDSFNREATAAVTFAQRLSDTLSFVGGYSRLQAHEPRLSNAAENGGLYSDYHGGVCPRNLDWGATPCNEFDPRDIETVRGLFKLEWRPSTEHRLVFSLDTMRRVTDVQFNQNLGPDTTGIVTRADDRRLEVRRQRFALDYQWTPSAGILDELRATLSFTPNSYETYRLRQRTLASGQHDVVEDWLDYAEDFFELDIQATRRFRWGAAEHELTFGFDGDRTTTDYERITVTNNLTTGTRTESRAGGFNFANATTRRADFYIQDRITWAGGRFELTPGLRYATYAIDPRPNPDYVVVPGLEPVRRSDARLLASLGARWQVNESWSVWGNLGQGFKMPTAQQLYTSLPSTGFTLIPAPDLLPEEVESIEIGVRGQFGRGYLSVSAYHANYTNFIESLYNIPGTTYYTYRNISERETWGLELAGEWQVRQNLTLTGSLHWQQGVQRATPTSAETPANLAPLTGVLGLSWEIPERNLTLDFMTRFASGVTRTASATGFRPGGYGLLDIYGRWDITPQASLNFGITNVFDRRYFQPSAIGVTTTPSLAVARQNPLDLHTGPGRTFSISLNTRF